MPMSTPTSPRKFNGLTDEDRPTPLFTDMNFSQELSGKMRVPKRIKATGEYSDEDLLLSNQNGIMNSWTYHDKIDMNVPDRIVVIGQDQHLGTRSTPREIVLDNSILPTDPGFVRVQTPPRVITLSEHVFPTIEDNGKPNNGFGSSNYIRAGQNGHITVGFDPNAGYNNSNMNDTSSVEDESERRQITNSSRKSLNYNDTTIAHRDGTPPIGDLSPSEEIMYLRRQLAKLNRRVLSIEIDNVQRQQREKIIYCLGLAYFLLKTIFWLNKN
ncbi:transport and Golgi organization protein 11 [Condylostylus longicornis]|uniref:transport and Golgi organization protein 11 n=1 Tax=Condylostylus longicornis TaxID=2530218 RepID=UPI00244DF044|nr:transport and Golgi organization protein 11 [Condylostylus longicornis]XP_055383389.1 transport and Golgi organization protein 11 [Condylostylus longicornis]XP_055383390.1 transport and Golgi organization protein 11 [Condylostylus longicornis]